MNRFVSLLLAALCLAAVSLAQPAQAQWTMGKPYFGSGNTQSSQPGTSVTATINTSTTGHLNITSTPINASPGYSTGGTYNGNVSVGYTWTGNNPNGTAIATTQSLEATGASNGNSSGNSNAGSASGSFSSGSGWDQKTTPANQNYYFGPGVTPTIPIQTVSLSGTVSAYYNSAFPGASTTVTADVTFGFTLK